MKKILYCASTASHILNFHLPYLEAFHNMGYEVHVAVNEKIPVRRADKVIALPFRKSIFSFSNILAIIQSRKVLKRNSYEKVITNTTLAGVIVRFAALFMKNRPRVYHIVHGYIFNADSGLKKYLYLIPEKIAATISDVVMVMNQEDQQIAEKHKLYREKLYYIEGMGVNTSRFKVVSPEKKEEYKRRLGFEKNKFLFAYVAEFSKRKNQKMLINAFSKCKLENAHLLLAGDGRSMDACKRLVNKLGQANRIHFLGYVKDVPSLYCACDCAISTSKAEGLPFNIIEAMGCGLPVIASDIKGHKELVESKVNGYLFKTDDEMHLIKTIENAYKLIPNKIEQLRKNSINKAQRYTLNTLFHKIMQIYQM